MQGFYFRGNNIFNLTICYLTVVIQGTMNLNSMSFCILVVYYGKKSFVILLTHRNS